MLNRRKSLFLLFSLMFFTILLLTNCSVQKRVHLKGWNIEWRTKVKESDANKEINSSATIETGKDSNFYQKTKISRTLQTPGDTLDLKENYEKESQSITKNTNQYRSAAKNNVFGKEHQQQLEKRAAKNQGALKKNFFLPLFLLSFGLILLLFTLFWLFGPSVVASSSLAGILMLFLSLLLILLGLVTLIKLLFAKGNKSMGQLEKNHSPWFNTFRNYSTSSVNQHKTTNAYFQKSSNPTTSKTNIQFGKRVTSPLLLIGIVLILFGAFVLVASIIALMDALAVGIMSSGFGVIGVAFAILVGAILFVLGLALLIIHLSKRQQEKKNVEQIVTEDKKQETEIESEIITSETSEESDSNDAKTPNSNNEELWIIGVAAALIALFLIVK